MRKDESIRVICGTCGHEHNNAAAAGENPKDAACHQCGSTGKLVPVATKPNAAPENPQMGLVLPKYAD